MDLNVPSATVLVLVLPCLLGAVLARFGNGRWLWSAALAALVLSLLGLSTFTSAIAQQRLTEKGFSPRGVSEWSSGPMRCRTRARCSRPGRASAHWSGHGEPSRWLGSSRCW